MEDDSFFKIALLVAMGVIIVSLVTGCATADRNVAHTTIHYQDGQRVMDYASGKDQKINYVAGADGKPQSFSVESSTPEAAIAAAAQAQAKAMDALTQVLNTVLPIINSAVQGGLIGGGPGAAAGAGKAVLTPKPAQ